MGELKTLNAQLIQRNSILFKNYEKVIDQLRGIFSAYKDLKDSLEKADKQKLDLENTISILEKERDLLKEQLQREIEHHRVMSLNIEV